MSIEFVVDPSSPWFHPDSGWPEKCPKQITIPDLTLGDLLRKRAQETPNFRAVWFLNHTITYEELDRKVDHFASGLLELGLKKGETLLLVLPNSIQYVIAYYAAARIGAIVSGVNPTYKPAELMHQMKLTKAKGLVYLDALYDTMVAPALKEIPVSFSISTNIADCLNLGFVKKRLGFLLGKIPTGDTHLDSHEMTEVLKTPVDLSRAEPVRPEDTAIYLMTGGTTGVPKAAVLNHFNSVANVLQCKAWIEGLKEGACLVGVIPLFHAFAMTVVMNVSVSIGAWMMLFPRPPATKELLEAINENCPEELTVYPGAEILFKRIGDFPEASKMGVGKKFLCCISGAGPLHQPVREKFESVMGTRLVEGYGLSETSPVAAVGPIWGKPLPGSIGLPLPGTDFRIVDPTNPEIRREALNTANGEEAQEGKHIGEIAISGPQVMQEYLDQPEETASTLVEIDGKRWCLTGDIGFMDHLGRTYIRDRKKELIKVSGYSVFPKEVEELIHRNESVQEVVVAGVPHPKKGEIVKAWVIPQSSVQDQCDPAALVSWCKENMAHYKVPGEIEIVDSIPKNAIGKVLRRVLVEEHVKKTASRA